MSYNDLVRCAKKEWSALHNNSKPLIIIGTATCGSSAGALDILKVLQKELKAHKKDCNVIKVGCMGLCYAEPLIIIKKLRRPAICYNNVTKKKAIEIIQSYLLGNDPLPKYALGTIAGENIKGIENLFSTPVLKLQKRRILRNCGFIDPANINHYIACGGYSGFNKVLTMDAGTIINEIKKSGLRGRGGAGFPTWKKWQVCLEEKADKKYIICNADEGDPGAFMNRTLLESDPHSLLEGMLIAGFTIGASEGFIYCRAEYPLALERLKYALAQLKSCGLIGRNILGSSFDFRIKIKEGAGAFVCGEETALIASLEGRRGMPSPRPPFPAISGLNAKPTTINNVETLASVTLILEKGADWFTQCGSKTSYGTKTFALAGKIKRTGLVEVPLGITLRKMIYDIGGGILNNRKFKAIQTGGPSGGCLPESLLNIRIDYDSLNKAGSIMGSGGMVVMDQDNCMVDIARYFLDFAQKESCGKCVPCRLGTKQMLNILEDITVGRGKLEDINLLEHLAKSIKIASLCGLGQTAPNPVLTTIRYFRKEYEAHVTQKRCPAGVCKALVVYSINQEKCKSCAACFKACPYTAIKRKENIYRIDRRKCQKCGICKQVCKFKAIDI